MTTRSAAHALVTLCAVLGAAGCNGTVEVGPAVRLFDERAVVTGDGASGCTHEEHPAGKGDRWCAIALPSPSRPGRTELWVLDVTRAATGKIPPCDGSSPSCLRMTDNLWTAFPTAGPGHPYSHAFDGDTLIFYANADLAASTQLHRGPVYAWRPGWSEARALTSDRGLLCYGHPRAAVAYCMDDVAGDPMHPDSFELRAGALDAAVDAPLPSLGRVRPFKAEGAVAWQAGFSPAGDVFAISSPDPDPAVETLRVVPTALLGRTAAREIVRDLTTWKISHDGQTLYFLREESKGVRALYAAAFPAGTPATRLDGPVRDYVVAGEGAAERGVGFLAAGEGDQVHFRLLRDPTMPAQAATLFSTSDELEGVNISADGRYTAWRDASLVARVVRHDDLGSCVLNTPEVRHATMPQFSSDAGLLFWTQETSEDDSRQQGFVGTADCQHPRRFAEGVDLLLPIADRGLVFTDAYEDRDFTGTLKVAALTGAGAERGLGTPRRVQDGVSTVVAVGTNPLLLIFRKKIGAANETGTYLFGPVPF